jgi:hypothetical protein
MRRAQQLSINRRLHESLDGDLPFQIQDGRNPLLPVMYDAQILRAAEFITGIPEQEHDIPGSFKPRGYRAFCILKKPHHSDNRRRVN